MSTDDPMERIIAEALTYAAVPFVCEPHTPHNLDFHLPGPDVAIEVKQMHSDRIAVQMARHPDVIAIQGKRAVTWFAVLLRDCEVMRQELRAMTDAYVALRDGQATARKQALEEAAKVADASAETCIPLMRGIGVSSAVEQGRHRAATEIATAIRAIGSQNDG